MSAVVLRGDAAHLPLPDESVDLLLCSPPYWGLRQYEDGGQSMAGQIGTEETPGEFIAALLACTREWMRVLKPEGSIFVNLGDRYAQARGHGHWECRDGKGDERGQKVTGFWARRGAEDIGLQPKSLCGLPWRYALACTDDLGLILRAEIIWDKPNGLPESVTDRVRRSHEQVFHFTKQPRYFSAVDEIREPPSGYQRPNNADRGLRGAPDGIKRRTFADTCNPLGKLPGSVWEIPSAPLVVPAHLGVDHFAAYPPELCRRIILGWSPSGICVECGEGRQPLTVRELTANRKGTQTQRGVSAINGGTVGQTLGWERVVHVTGYACACAPFTDHPGTGGSSGEDGRYGDALNRGDGYPRTGYSTELHARPKVGPWREYHLEDWIAPPTRPACVVDPFGGTGTTSLVADVLGRIGITVDRSADYCRLARWRTRDPAERARALGVPKPPPVPDGQASLFDLEAS